jgi:hypothetical protein
MAYDPATDFFGLWRNNGAGFSKLAMPGLDVVVAALSRAGLINLSVSATAPVANQDVTAWLQAAVPSYSAEGVLRLWDPVAATYVAATPALLLEMLQASAGQNGVSWYATTGGAPANVVGLDGDYAIQTDAPGGIYGPKAAGAWPADPLPGTTDIIDSTQLDLTFGNTPGLMLYRGATEWEVLAIAAANSVMISDGAAPLWSALSTLLDVVFGNAQGSILYRDAASWDALGPGAADEVLATGGAGANPAWAPRTAEFPAGTVMLFQQTNAPTGWTKQTALNDYALRVTSGAVGSVPGSAFSTVFAQTAVGNTTLDTTQIPAHTHPASLLGASTLTVTPTAGASALQPAGSNTGSTGGGAAHTHSINLTLSYVDVIIASKN